MILPRKGPQPGTGHSMIISATNTNLDRAAAALRAGELVAFPTETVYGLGADATNGEAVAAIYEAKGRPRFNPLIVHLPDRGAADAFATLNDAANRLAAAFWPGPLTLIAGRVADCRLSELVSAGLDTVALRVPDHPVAQRLLESAACPVAAPSANRSGHVSPTTAAHVEADFKGMELLILDGGSTPFGLESTVVDTTGSEPVLLRPGSITRENIEEVLGCKLSGREEGGALRSPGLLDRHYAPDTELVLNVDTPMPDDAVLAFGPFSEQAPVTINLSPKGDLREAAANLFGALRTLDSAGAKRIAVLPIPDIGLGEAINDRLRRAATR